MLFPYAPDASVMPLAVNSVGEGGFSYSDLHTFLMDLTQI